MARARSPPVALSSSVSDAGTSLPWARATASRGVSIWGRAAVATALVTVLADMLDNALGERGGRDLGRAGQLPGEIVGDPLGGDGPLDAANDGRGHIRPAKLFEHHGAREDDAAGVDLVLPRVLGRGAVRRLVHGVAVAHVAARGEAEAAHLGRRRIGQQVAVEVRGGDDGVLVRPQHELSEHCVGDAVLDDDPSRVPLPRSQLGLRNGLVAEPLPRDLVPPLSKPALGELHDVALVHERHRGAPRLDGVLNRLRNQPLRPELRHRLDADRAAGADLRSVAFREKPDDGVGLLTARLILDARIDVLDVLAEDHHIELPRLLHGRRHAFEVAHGPDAGVEVEHLAQRDVERADPAADGRGEGPLDRDAVCADRVKRRLGEPAVCSFEGLLPGQHLEPFDPAAACGRPLDCRVEHAARGAPDVGARAVALDERDNGPIGHDPTSLLELDAVTHLPVFLRGSALVVGAVYTLRLGSRHRPCDSAWRGLHHPNRTRFRNPSSHGGVVMRIGRRSGSLALVLMVVACERSPETITGNAPRPSMATTTSTAGAANPQATIGINVLLTGPATAAQLAELDRLGTVYDQIPELNALLIRAQAGQLAAIQALPFVVAANPDAERKGAPVDAVSVSDFVLGRNTWDLDAINVTNLVPGPDNDRTITFDGSGVYVGVLDTGLLDSWREYFPQQRLATRHATAFSGGGASGNGNVPDLPNQWEHDQNSHGTHVTSTILGYSLFGTSINGVAPLATVIPVKVLKQSGIGWSSIAARGIIYVADLKTGPLAGHPVVINMSLGGPTLDAVEQAAIDFAISKGVIIVAAAGNEGEKGMGFPGAYGPVISAAASGWIGEGQPGAAGHPRHR